MKSILKPLGLLLILLGTLYSLESISLSQNISNFNISMIALGCWAFYIID